MHLLSKEIPNCYIFFRTLFSFLSAQSHYYCHRVINSPTALSCLPGLRKSTQSLTATEVRLVKTWTWELGPRPSGPPRGLQTLRVERSGFFLTWYPLAQLRRNPPTRAVRNPDPGSCPNFIMTLSWPSMQQRCITFYLRLPYTWWKTPTVMSNIMLTWHLDNQE